MVQIALCLAFAGTIDAVFQLYTLLPRRSSFHKTVRELKMSTLSKKTLFDPETYKECLERIDKLTPESRPEWGSMSSAQMLAHCAEIQEVSNGKDLKNTPFIVRLFKGMIRNMVVNDKPYPKSTKTHPQFLQSSEREFNTEKERLLKALDIFVTQQKRSSQHPLFGEMSEEERGWGMYKHLDHHLKQFGL